MNRKKVKDARTKRTTGRKVKLARVRMKEESSKKLEQSRKSTSLQLLSVHVKRLPSNRNTKEKKAAGENKTTEGEEWSLEEQEEKKKKAGNDGGKQASEMKVGIREPLPG